MVLTELIIAFWINATIMQIPWYIICVLVARWLWMANEKRTISNNFAVIAQDLSRQLK